MIKYMVIGDPIAHSRSPGMQNAAFEFHGLGSPYGIRHVRPDELGGFIEFARANLKGVNLTVPHKAAVIPYLDTVDPAAKAAGSVNTLIIENGRIHGASTDGYGPYLGTTTRLKQRKPPTCHQSVKTRRVSGLLA